ACQSRGLARDCTQARRPAAGGDGSAGPATAPVHAAGLFRRGMAMEEVARETNRARSTTVQYLCEFIRAESPPSVAPWVAADPYRNVAEVATRVRRVRL